MRKTAKAATLAMEPKIEPLGAEEPLEEPAFVPRVFTSLSNDKSKEQKMLSLLDHVKSLESILSTTRFELL